MDRSRVWVYGIGGFIFGGLLGGLGPALFSTLSDPALMIIIPPICAIASALTGVWIAQKMNSAENQGLAVATVPGALSTSVPSKTLIVLFLFGIAIFLITLALDH